MIEREMVTLDEACRIVEQHTPTLDSEDLNTAAALGRVLSTNIHARRDHPPWDNSAMDGYAVRWQDVLSQQYTLPVQGESAAGSRPDQTLAAGSAMAIMTGAPVPAGADTVIRVEHTQTHDKQIHVSQEARAAANIRRRGEDLRSGELTLAANTLLRPGELGLLATANHTQVQVYRQPQISILATGDELAAPGSELAAHQIIDANSSSISALVREAGAQPQCLAAAPDDADALQSSITQALQADVALIVGGVSLGKYDLAKDVLQGLGCQIKFWRVAMRPGHPVVFAVRPAQRENERATLLFGLPGNPVSCMVAFYQFVRPALRQMMGLGFEQLPRVEAICGEDFKNHPGRLHLARAIVDYQDGHYLLRLAPNQGSGILTSMHQANALAMLDAKRDHYRAGEQVTVQLLPSGFY